MGEERETDSFYLGSVHQTGKGSTETWTVSLMLGNTPVMFKIDTGADVTVISEKTFENLQTKRELSEANVVLNSPGGQLNCVGQFRSSIRYKAKQYELTVYVVKGPRVNNLLSGRAAKEMGLVKRIEEVGMAFRDHGILKTEPVKILLKEGAEPYAVNTARQVPLPLLQKVKQELGRMEVSGVIEKVTQATDWCAPMVPVINPIEQVRICVDLKKLNENIKRERFMLPTTDEILAKLTGAKVFTSLDAASGFWQIPLHPESCRLTTFITPFARYCFKRLPFGINIAPEIFQQKMQELLTGLEGVQVYIDDVIVYGASMQEHDTRLKRVVDENGVREDPEKVKAIANLKPQKTCTN
ncbi:hypothetical protein H4Q32_024338 [Labeo rohita]|uniref:ribonuclease H n=1 Tax=Labeo rohita TaxID=84645 RepID=A0ABQ8LYK6_LABRO|nr:hypothetical protein H4Q32_024338 [Labeo rohita]